MNDFVLYNLKAGACLAGFYLFYKLLLSRETLHRMNRIVLLLLTVLSFVLPLCVVTIERTMPAPVLRVEPLPVPIDMPLVAPVMPSLPPSLPVAPPKPFPWSEVTLMLLLAGGAGALAWSVRSLVEVVCMIRRGRREPLGDGIVLVRTPERITPFSWLRYIVLCDGDYYESGPQIIAHERAHIRLRHSFDLALTDLCSCLQWFNPAMWLLRQELRAIHEYEADQAVLRNGVDARSYQMLLIKKAVGGRWYSVANSLNHSNLKSRITMMLRKRSSRWAAAKALLLLPLVGVALGAFARTTYVVSDDKVTQNSENPQGFTGWMGVMPDGEGRMRFELEGEGDAIRGALGLMNYYSILYLGDEPRTNSFVRLLTALIENPQQAVTEFLDPLVLVDGRPLDAVYALPDGDRIASIILYDPSAGCTEFGTEGMQGAVAIRTKQAGAPNPAVQQALQPQEPSPDRFLDRSCWFTGRDLVGDPDGGGVAMSGSFALLPLTKEEQQSRFDSAMKKNEVVVPDDWMFNGKCAVRMDGEDRAVATVYGYGDAMMAAASVVNPMRSTLNGEELPLERRRLGKIIFRLSRTAAATPEWMAVPMPLTLVDGRRITRMEEVPDAGRILRIEALGRTSAMKEYGPEGEAGAVRITTKTEGSDSDAEVEAERRKGAVVTSAMSDQGPKPEQGFYFGGGSPTVEQDDVRLELLKEHLPKFNESTARNGIEDLEARMQALYDSILRVRPAGRALETKLLADQFTGQLSFRIPDSERAIFYMAGKGDGMMALASCLWDGYMPLGRTVYRLSYDGVNSPGWQGYPMPYILVDGRRITASGEVPRAERIRRIEVLGRQRAEQRFGAAGADGAVLIDTKPADVATDALVEAEKNQGVGFFSVGVTSFILGSPEAETPGTYGPDYLAVREPARKMKRVGSSSFSGQAAFVPELGGVKATCYLAGEGDGMMAIASQLWRETPELSNVAYRLSKKGAADRVWKNEPMPYTFVDGRRIDRAGEVPDARYIAQVVVVERDFAVHRFGPDARGGAVLMLTKEPGDDNLAAVEAAKARGAGYMSAGRMTYEALSPAGVLRLAAMKAAKRDTAVQSSTDAGQAGPVQTTITSSGEPEAVHADVRMKRSLIDFKNKKIVMIAGDAGCDTIFMLPVDTVHDDLGGRRSGTGKGLLIETWQSAPLAGDVQAGRGDKGSDYRVVFLNASTEHDPTTGYLQVADTSGPHFRIMVGKGYRDVLVFLDGEPKKASCLKRLDSSEIVRVKLLRTDDELAPYGERAAEGKIAVELYTAQGWRERMK